MRPLLLPVLVTAALAAAGCGPPQHAQKTAAPAGTPAPVALKHATDMDECGPWEEDVTGILLDDRFDALDSLAATFKPGALTFRDGSSRERRFYGALAGECYRLSKGQRARLVAALRRWHAAKPASRPAAAGYAYALARLAWDERSGRVAALVSDQQFARMAKDLDLAWKAIEPTWGERGNVGGWYMAASRIGLGMGWERGRMMQVRNDCFRDAPWIETVDGAVARYLLPRWYGDDGEWESYADVITTGSPDGRGAQRYAWIAIGLQEVHGNLFRETHASWDRVNEGFRALEREHPDSVTLPSWHARFAWCAGDREAARALFATLGDRVDVFVWHGEQEFLAARAWADAPPS